MPVNGPEFKQRLTAKARTLGAAAVGVCAARPVADAPRLHAWLSEGLHAGMGDLARTAALRADPRQLVPGARSVLVVAVAYGPSAAVNPTAAEDPTAPADPTASAAPTASADPAAPEVPAVSAAQLAGLFVGQDYHRVVGRLLTALAVECQRAGGSPAHTLAAVDTRPLLERSLAVQAGLGVIGRSTQLLIPGLGSRVALGVLLTDLELPPDAPLSWDPCGHCTACVDACPAGALHRRAEWPAGPGMGSGGLDAARCLSYLTTASREPIPTPLRPLLGPRLYGCDVCQDVCPQNVDPQDVCPQNVDPQNPPDAQQILPALQGPGAVPLDRLHELASLSGRALRRALSDTAMSWLPPRIFLRTLAVVLGNLGRPESRPVLEALARDHHDAMVRDHARWALDR